MLSRSMGYNPYQGVGYNSNSNMDPYSLPSLNNYLHNMHSSPYNFHTRSQTQQMQSYQPQFDARESAGRGNSLHNEGYLGAVSQQGYSQGQKQSHARNFQGRLDGITTEAKKQKEMQDYRKDLQRQIQETRERKKAEKEKIDREEMQRQRKFYAELQIKPQEKGKGQVKEDPGFFMMRTVQKINKDKKNDKNVEKTRRPVEQAIVIQNTPPKPRGKIYHNKSSLDRWDKSLESQYLGVAETEKKEQNKNVSNLSKYDYKLNKMEEEIVKERLNEEERLSKLLLFQNRVLQKITDIKQDIRSTVLHLDGDQELQRVRKNLRAKPIPFQDEYFKSDSKQNNNMGISQYYSLPHRGLRPVLNRKYSIKLKDSNSNVKGKIKGGVKSEVSEIGQQLESSHVSLQNEELS